MITVLIKHPYLCQPLTSCIQTVTEIRPIRLNTQLDLKCYLSYIGACLVKLGHNICKPWKYGGRNKNLTNPGYHQNIRFQLTINNII